MEGKECFEVWKDAMTTYGTEVEENWEQLSVAEKAAWECVAEEVTE